MSEPEEMTEEAVEKIAEAVPQFVESMTKIKIQFGLLGAICGAAAGGMAAFAIAYRKAEREQSARADAEIAEMREHFRAKGMALEAQAGKVDLDKIIKDRGYKSKSPEPETSSSPPMAVKPPESVAEEPPDDSAMAENDVEGPKGVKARGEAVVQNIFREHSETATPEWDRHKELRRRSPDTPYVVHYDERHEMEGYSDISLTYYEQDDVLCNERDEVVDPAERDRLVGEANLERFGHGSNDPNIVFVRNDSLEILYEIVKSPNSFAEEVHGFTHEAWNRGNLERMRRRELRDEEG